MLICLRRYLEEVSITTCFHQDISRNLQFQLHSYLKSNPIGKFYNAPFDVYLDDLGHQCHMINGKKRISTRFRGGKTTWLTRSLLLSLFYYGTV
jgi:hypothetical protein